MKWDRKYVDSIYKLSLESIESDNYDYKDAVVVMLMAKLLETELGIRTILGNIAEDGITSPFSLGGEQTNQEETNVRENNPDTSIEKSEE